MVDGCLKHVNCQHHGQLAKSQRGLIPKRDDIFHQIDYVTACM